MGIASLVAVALAIDASPAFALIFFIALAAAAPFALCKLSRILLPTSIFYSGFLLWVSVCDYLSIVRDDNIELASKTKDIFAQVDLATTVPFYSNSWIVGSVGAILFLGILVSFAWSTRLYRRLI
jgi:hypothetical protein